MDRAHGRRLVELARSAVEAAARGRIDDAAVVEPWLQEPGATFITLNSHGRLRGCIGSLEPRLPLIDDLRANASAAALQDSRFKPVRPDELAGLSVEVSVLTPLEPIDFAGEDDLLAQLRPGVDGLVISGAGRRATFLPQVWQSLPRATEFLAALRRKAGLPPSFLSEELEAWRFGVEKFSE